MPLEMGYRSEVATAFRCVSFSSISQTSLRVQG